ncbi:hypothetical protein [Hymenobacter sp. CRA2]|uniref:hypothetical protein n=1 Tax=Hymenobacter sp. CRA2 TaxID=1955620 RepID=UPI0009CD24B6|nr:hypothetical protein [Hymenobacter sp. CRA2]OON66972.1 hypothetical protein B0919_20560 [Hymenobacter sp. CRA2]
MTNALKFAWWLGFGMCTLLTACERKSQTVSSATLTALDLKRGNISLCGPADKQFGSVAFEVTGSDKIKADFSLAVALLHSFEYDAAEKVFARIIDQDPGCAMAYWGVAMCNYHPLWTPPTPAELAKGARAVALAQQLPGKSARETAYIDALTAFYADHQRTDHHTRSVRFAQAMTRLATNFPRDTEATIFYALALDASAAPTDKTFRNQRKAGALLQRLQRQQPNHPGIVHYLIHTYDYPELAALALPAARHYASVAPSSAHALHMPSHIFTRLGLWQECIGSNLAAAASAQCYAESAGLPGHWDEELHSLDYLVYAYLQQGDTQRARSYWRYLDTIRQVTPVTFKVAYAYAAIPARCVLETKQWDAAAQMPLRPANFAWDEFPWQRAITHFARALGSARTGHAAQARTEVAQLSALHAALLQQHDAYKARQVDVQQRAAEAWLLLAKGKHAAALQRMQQAADLEDQTEKHPVTPSEVLPARELLADMLLELQQPAAALAAYEATLQKHPNRFNALYGAATAAEKAGQSKKATLYYQQLLTVAPAAETARPELAAARLFLTNLQLQFI